MSPIPKKSLSQIDLHLLIEPVLSPEDRSDYAEGWRLFNEHQFWHAHEAWESVWKRRPEESRIFFQGIIQLAAAYHLLVVKQRYGGMMRNFEKAEVKLRLFPSSFLGVNVGQLLSAIRNARVEIARIGAESLERFDLSLIPTVHPEL